jgi:hypothetical protein
LAGALPYRVEYDRAKGPVCIAQNPYANLTVLFSFYFSLIRWWRGWVGPPVTLCVCIWIGIWREGRAIFGTSVAGKSFAKF